MCKILYDGTKFVGFCCYRWDGESCPESENLSVVEKERELKDIRKLMSLNDKFRFRRELFVTAMR